MPSDSAKKPPQILILGPPNSGKTTLFNNLTGHNNKTVNYPGSTVLISRGGIQRKYSLQATLTDTPGSYSVFSKPPTLIQKLLFSKKDPVRAALVTIDSGKLQAHLPFLFQLKETGLPLVLVLSMWENMSDGFSLKTLKEQLNIPVVPVKGLIGDGIAELVEELKKTLLKKSSLIKQNRIVKAWSEQKMGRAIREAENIMSKCRFAQPKDMFLSKKYDRFLLHPVMGFMLFVGIMFTLFSSLFWLAEPFMSLIDGLFGKAVEGIVSFNPRSGFMDFLGKGLVGSLGAVFVFVPQIFILFFGIHLLEGSGYLARAVTLVDGFFSKLGLSGHSFVPFLSGYACAIPAALATRGLASRRERFMTLFAIPFMSCSRDSLSIHCCLGFSFTDSPHFCRGFL